MNVEDLRREYEGHGLHQSDVDPDPIAQFGRWFNDALSAGVLDANALSLATADADGMPSVRTVLIKGYDAAGFVFYTNYASGKGLDLAANPRAAMMFYWQPLSRQVRIAGTVTQTSRAQSEAYFAVRPRGAQISAAASAQSKAIPSRDALERIAADIAAGYEGRDIPCPDNWGGYIVRPQTIEFWQGRPDRLHDRLRYTRREDGWKIQRLAP
jgi:pyridoxamine 5'-phosphate oxidase